MNGWMITLYVFVGIFGFIEFCGILGFIWPISEETKEKGIQIHDLENYFSESEFNEIWSVLRDDYLKYMNEYKIEMKYHKNKMRLRYLFLYFPGISYNMSLKESGFFEKHRENARILMQKYTAEILSKYFIEPFSLELKYNRNENLYHHSVYGAYKDYLNSKLNPELTDKKSPRFLEEEIAYSLINSGFIDTSYFDFTEEELSSIKYKSNIKLSKRYNNSSLRIDSNTLFSFKNSNSTNFNLYNISLKAREVVEINGYNKEVFRNLLNGLICIIDKPLINQSKIRLSGLFWPLMISNFYSIDQALIAYQFKGLVDIRAYSNKTDDIKDLFKNIDSSALIEEIKKSRIPVMIFSDPASGKTIISVNSFYYEGNRDLSAEIISASHFFKNEERAKKILAEDFYELKTMSKYLNTFKDYF